MIVYKCTCRINGKVYIGITKNPIETRMAQHKSKANRGSRLKFHLALLKYGFENFDWECIHTTDNLGELFDREKYFIALFQSNGSMGYNMTDGGEIPNAMIGSENPMFGKTHSESVKNVIRDKMIGVSWEERLGVDASNKAKLKLINAHVGRKNTEETINKMIENSFWKNNGHLVLGENNPNFGHHWDESKKDKVRGENNGMFGIRRTGSLNGMFGKNHSEEAKALMSKSRSGTNNPRYRPIDCLDLAISIYNETGSIGKAARATGENYNKIKREFILNGIINKEP